MNHRSNADWRGHACLADHVPRRALHACPCTASVSGPAPRRIRRSSCSENDPNHAVDLGFALGISVIAAIWLLIVWAQHRSFTAEEEKDRDRAQQILGQHLAVFAKVVDGLFTTIRDVVTAICKTFTPSTDAPTTALPPEQAELTAPPTVEPSAVEQLNEPAIEPPTAGPFNVSSNPES
ncbi:hypothetical protein ACIRRA_44795 [Nocardia sp. NPDC101769]|uniref:hypothetical protein n=1 Tax=Nocardia sp. NPDC101769 TaxID=3364333 RepID=UPI003830C9E5